MSPGGGTFGGGAFGDDGTGVLPWGIQDFCTATDTLKTRIGIGDHAGVTGTVALFTASTLVVTLGGVDITAFVHRYDTSIDLANGATPSTASVKVRGKSGRTIIPLEGQRLTITLGPTSTVLFDGEVTTVERVQARATTRPSFQLQCIDWTFQFDMDYIVQDYLAQTPNAIITDVLTHTAGFTAGDVESNLSWLDAVASLQQSYRYQRPSQVLQAIATRVGGAFRVQFNKSVYLRVTNTLTSPTALTDTNTGFKQFRYRRSIDQFRSLVDAVGSGSFAVSVALNAGATVIPVPQAWPFALPAGVATGQAQLQIPYGVGSLARLINLSYTGTSRAGTVAPPTSTMVAGCGPTGYLSGGVMTTNSIYQYAFSFATAVGETALSSISVAVFLPNTQSKVLLSLAGLFTTANAGQTHLPPDASITAVNIYRTQAGGGSQFFKVGTLTPASSNTNWLTTFTDNIADSALATAPSGLSVCPQGQTTAVYTTSGSTTTALAVDDCTAFDPAGGYLSVVGRLVPYSGVTYSLSGGNFKAGTVNLPTAITFSIPNGVTVTATPALTGCGCTLPATVPTLAPQSIFGSTAGPTIGTLYGYAVTFVTAAGETTPSGLSSVYDAAAPAALTGLTATNKGSLTGPTNGGVYSWLIGHTDAAGVLSPLSSASANLTSNGTAAHLTWTGGDTNDQSVLAYRTKAGGSTYFTTGLQNQSVGVADDTTSDASLTVLMTASWNQWYRLRSIPIGPTGTTARKLYRNTGPNTALQLLTTIADNTTITFDDSIANGSLGAAAPSTDTSGLTGLPPIAQGSVISLYTQIGDATAQAALAAKDGSSGIHRFYVASAAPDVTSLLQEATAELAAGKPVIETATYVCEDARSQPNATVPITLTPAQGAAINTTLTIQRVGISWKNGRRMPQFAVTASNQYTDIYEYLTQMAQKTQKLAA